MGLQCLYPLEENATDQYLERHLFRKEALALCVSFWLYVNKAFPKLQK